MSDWDEDDDRPAEFPWLLWIPVVQAIVHCLLIGLLSCLIFGVLTLFLPPMAVIALPLGIGFIALCIAAIRGCLRILSGTSESYSVLPALTFIAGLLSTFLAIGSGNEVQWFWLFDSMLLFTSAGIAWYCQTGWTRWKRKYSMQNEVTQLYSGNCGSDEDWWHRLFNAPPN